MAKKLRHAADVLDELLGVVRASAQNETPEVARQIRHAIAADKKPHWTNTPKGRKILAARKKRVGF